MPNSNGQDRLIGIDRGTHVAAGQAPPGWPAAEASAARLGALCELVPSALMDLDPATLRILRVNQRMRELLDAPIDAPPAGTLFDLLPPKDHGTLRDVIAAFAEGSDIPVVFAADLGLETGPGSERRTRGRVSLTLKPVRTAAASLVCILASAAPAIANEVDGDDLARACEIASIAVAERDLASGRVTRVNASFCRLVGYSEAQLLTMTIEDLTPPEELDTIRRRLAPLASGSVTEYTAMKELLCSNGSRCWVLGSISRLPGKGGTPDRLITVYINVNEVVSARTALMLSEARYRTLVDTMPDAVSIVDREGNTTFVNRAMVSLLGFPTRHWIEGGESAISRSLDARGVEQQRQFWAYLESHDEFDTRPLERSWTRRDGRTVSVEQRAASLRNDRGEVIGALFVLRDVTEDRRSRLERERMAAIVEASEDAIFSVSRTHVVESWNSGCVRLFDLQPWLAVLRPLDGLFPAPLGGLLGQMIDQAAAGHPVRNADWPAFTEGRARWVVSMRAVRARDGDASSVSVIVRDISAEIAATQALDDERRFIRTVLDTMPIAVSVRDALGCVLLANHRFDALFGKDGGSTTGTRYEDRIPDAAEIERMMHRDAEVLRSGLPITYERRMHAAGGGDVDLHTVKVPLLQSGETRILTASVDVSDRIRAQDDLRRERAFMRTVIDTDPTLISVKDARGRFLLANRAAAEALGCTVEALEGHCLSEALPGANIDAVIARHDAEALRLQRPVTHEECQRVAGGKERWFSSIRLPLAGADGEPVVLGVSTDITEMRLQARRIHELKNFDPLTGLPNRMLIEDRLQMALATAERDRSRVAVMFVDLDHFKTVNDSLGHPAGDRLLVGVSKRIRAVLRDSDSVGRLGGDEFLLVLPQVDGPEDAALIANKLLAALEGAFDIMDHSLTVNASIGIAFYPEDGATPHLLVQNADAAMYHAKEQGRSCYRFFTRALNARAARSLAMEHGMRRGLHDGEFELWYQPVYALADGSVAGMEALVRWRRSTGELLMPGDFIGVAEERGLISHLGRWVLEAACAFAATRSRAGLPAIPIAVNLSPIQLRQQGLAAMIDGTLRATGVDPSLIELELTEGSIMHDIGSAIDVLQQIRALGVRIAVDDFGTGHSSLAWLRQLPIDKLKIDRAFVANVPANAVDTVIFRTIVAMASAMGIRTVAEGVETREQLDCVRALGCDLVQGYLLAKPMPEGDIARVTGMRVDLSRKPAASEG